MARFSVGGDEDGNEEGSNNDRRLSKRPRTAAAAAAVAAPIVYTVKRSNASSSNSNSANPTSCLAAPAEELRREEPTPVEEISEDESEDESDSLLSDSPSEESEDAFEDEEEEEDQQNPRRGDEVQPTVEARLDSAAADGNGAANGGEALATISVTLTDPDVLDCPICLDPLSSPVYQCDNGHIACGACCNKMRNRCASCCLPIGYNRCRAIEKVLESVRISCRNKQHGCTASLNYSKKHDHEKTCIYNPCSCPYPCCSYRSSAKCLYTHFATDHQRSSKVFQLNYAIAISLGNNQKHVFLQDRDEQRLFVLSRSIEPLGSYFNVVCIAPTSSNLLFACDVSARAGVHSMQVKTVVETTSQWVAPAKRYTFIPKDFMTSTSELNLELTIWKDGNRQTV